MNGSEQFMALKENEKMVFLPTPHVILYVSI